MSWQMATVPRRVLSSSHTVLHAPSLIHTMSAIASSALVARVAPTKNVSARKAIGGASSSLCTRLDVREFVPAIRIDNEHESKQALTTLPTLPFPPSPPTTGVSLRPMLSTRASVRPTFCRSDRLVVRAEDVPEMPEFLKGLMKPSDASIAAPGWLAPVIGLAEEAGEDAPVVGYGIMGATGVFFGLLFAVIGLGAFGFLACMAGKFFFFFHPVKSCSYCVVRVDSEGF